MVCIRACLFGCLLFHHSFPTNPNSATNGFQLVAVLQLPKGTTTGTTNEFVLLNPNGSKTHVNGKAIGKNQHVTLNPDDRIIFGSSNVFRLYVPGHSADIGGNEGEQKNEAVEISWHYAMEELNEAQMAAFG